MEYVCIVHEIMGNKHVFTMICRSMLEKREVGKLVVAIDEAKYTVGNTYKIEIGE